MNFGQKAAISFLILFLNFANPQDQTTLEFKEGQTQAVDLRKYDENGDILTKIEVNPKNALGEDFWILKISTSNQVQNSYGLNALGIPLTNFEIGRSINLKKSKFKESNDDLYFFLVDESKNLFISKVIIKEGIIVKHQQIEAVKASFIDYDYEFKSSTVFLLKYLKTGFVEINSYSLEDEYMFQEKTSSKLRIMVMPSPASDVSQVIIYRIGYDHAWFLRFQTGILISKSRYSTVNKITSMRVILNRIIICTYKSFIRLSRTIIKYTYRNWYITLDLEFKPEFPSSIAKYLPNGKLTHVDSWGDSGKMRLIFINLVVGKDMRSEISTNMVYIDPFSFEDTHIENSRVFYQKGESLIIDQAISWVEGDYSLNYLFCHSRGYQTVWKWSTYLDSMQSIPIETWKNGHLNTSKIFSTRIGFLYFFSNPINHLNLKGQRIIIEEVMPPKARILLKKTPVLFRKNISISLMFTNPSHSQTTNLSIHLSSVDPDELPDDGAGILEFIYPNRDSYSVDQFKGLSTTSIIRGSFMMAQDAVDQAIDYFSFIQNGKINNVQKLGFFGIQTGNSSLQGLSTMQQRIIVDVNLDEVYTLIITKSLHNNYVSILDRNTGVHIFDATEIRILSGNEGIIKYINFRRILIILTSNLFLYKIDLNNRKINRIELPGRKCINFELITPKSLPALFICHVGGLEINLYFISDILGEKNKMGMLNFKKIGLSLASLEGKEANILTSKSFCDHFYLFFQVERGSFPKLIRVDLLVQESIVMKIAYSRLIDQNTNLAGRGVNIIDSIAINDKMIVISEYNKVQSIYICSELGSQGIIIFDKKDLTPLLRVKQDSRLIRFGRHRLSNFKSGSFFFDSLLLKVKTELGWNILHIDPSQQTSSYMPAFLLPVDSIYDFKVNSRLHLNFEFFEESIGIEFEDSRKESFKVCFAKFEVGIPSIDIKMITESTLRHNNLAFEEFKIFRGETCTITLANKKSSKTIQLNIQSRFDSEITILEKIENKSENPTQIELNSTSFSYESLRFNIKGDVFNKEYIFEEITDLIYKRIEVIPFLEHLNTLTVDIDAEIIAFSYTPAVDLSRIILVTKNPKGYLIMNDVGLLKNSSSVKNIEKELFFVNNVLGNELCLPIVATRDIIIEICTQENRDTVKVHNLHTLEHVELFIHILLQHTANYQITTLKKIIIIEKLSERGSVIAQELIHIDSTNGFFKVANKYGLYQIGINCKTSFRSNSMHELIVLEVLKKQGRPIAYLRIVSNFDGITFRSPYSLYSELYRMINIELQYPELFKDLSDLEINKNWLHELDESLILHFVDFKDQNSMIFGFSNHKSRRAVIFYVHNPFAGISHMHMIHPICRLQVCISASIFESNSYLKFYILPPDFREIVSDRVSEKVYDSSNSTWTSLDLIYTHSMLNLSMVITGIEWDPSLCTKQSLAFFVFSKKSIFYYRINLNEGFKINAELESSYIKIRQTGLSKVRLNTI